MQITSVSDFRKDTTYNGWTNYETWCVKLWMDNDEGSAQYWLEVVEEEEEDGDVAGLSARLKDNHEEMLPDIGGFAGDLLNAAMSEVNWHEIATNLLEDA